MVLQYNRRDRAAPTDKTTGQRRHQLWKNANDVDSESKLELPSSFQCTVPSFTFTMEHLYTGILLVDHKFHALTSRFAAETTANARIVALKQKAQEMSPSKLSSVELPDLRVWKMKGDMIIKKLTPQKLSEILGRIDIDDQDTIELLDDEEKVAGLGLSDGETLLVQLPGTSRIPTIVVRALIQV
jgi:hypothetical protein